MVKNKIWYLQKTNLFKEMSSEEMKELDRITVEESVKKKSAIFFPRDTLAEALDDSQLCVIQKTQFLSMIQRKPEYSFRLIKLIGFRLKKIENRVEDLVFRDVHSRVALLLLQFSKDYGRAVRERIQIGLKVTHQEIANLIGSNQRNRQCHLGRI